MEPEIREGKSLDAFAMIVDINRFASMVGASQGFMIAQFVRDVLTGAIKVVEEAGGEVVGFMGDAILGLVFTPESTASACFAIAKDLDAQCEWISQHQEVSTESWGFAPGGPSLKIGVEYGALDVSTISSRFLGEQKLVIGDAINHAARIITVGEGNRCLVGPQAAARGLKEYALSGPFQVEGKPGERTYEYFEFDLGDIWIQGQRREGGPTYWG